MHPRNCWEVKKCCRQTGGDHVAALGEGPPGSTFSCHGVNKGINGGVVCRAIAGTLGGGKVQACSPKRPDGARAAIFFARWRRRRERGWQPSRRFSKG